MLFVFRIYKLPKAWREVFYLGFKSGFDEFSKISMVNYLKVYFCIADSLIW
ncbi:MULTISPECIES: hypothetical protein [Helicobacter]|uniref:hypothetical protein n=1 Tax=Helicobacter TaxID=209 RepID=UPI000B01CF8A|nr:MULTISPECIES: hypothetical protein [Helicobacter]MCI7048031.1 hypothetical protein [Helicobacter sp.]MDY4426376.1 hypothetical protein [Helicobacter sp.]MDY5616547.1 hypothetical protein [Helicobacter sp.]